MIRAYAYAITRDFALTDDIAQEVSLIIAEQWDAMPHGDGEVGWIKETTRRKALESLRRWKPARAVLSPEALACIAAVADDEPAPDPRNAALAACLDKLGGDARSVVEGRYWRDQSCEQIAEALGRSVKSIYGILNRSRLALAACVERSTAGGGS
jgi:RNA polymerase sigma factor (sigma-70 family)